MRILNPKTLSVMHPLLKVRDVLQHNEGVKKKNHEIQETVDPTQESSEKGPQMTVKSDIQPAWRVTRPDCGTSEDARRDFNKNVRGKTCLMRKCHEEI